jgi:hypothetical protein
MSGPAAPLPCAGSEHLDVLVVELDRLAARLRAAVAVADPTAVAARRAEEDAATAAASLRLDGGLQAGADGTGPERAGTWLDALGGVATSDDAQLDAGTDAGADAGTGANTDAGADAGELARMAELEQAGVAAGVAATDLAPAFARASSDAGGLGTALAMLHARITEGLVAPERAGMLRRGPRVVHDASVGRVLFFPTDPALLPDAWDALLRHVTGSGAGGMAARLPSAIRSALLHLELVRHHPFDAANGRVARAAARLALLADGLLPGGLGAPDVVLAEDPLAYHEEVGASVRRRDATRWAERTLEAQGIALIRTLDALGANGLDDAPALADRPPDGLPGTFTLGDVRDLLGGDGSVARERSSAWVVAGTVERVVGSAGLRLRLR